MLFNLTSIYLVKSIIPQLVLLCEVTAIAAMDAAGREVVIVRPEQMRTVTKRCTNLDVLIKKGFATLCNQCSEQVMKSWKQPTGEKPPKIANYYMN